MVTQAQDQVDVSDAEQPAPSLSEQESTQQNGQHRLTWKRTLAYLNLMYSCADVSACVRRSIVLLFEGDHEAASEIINRVIEYHPDYGEAYVVRGVVSEVVGGLYSKRKSFREALDAYSKAVEKGAVDASFFEKRQRVIQQRDAQLALSDGQLDSEYNPPMFTPLPDNWYRRMNKKEIVSHIKTNHQDLFKIQVRLASII